MEQVHKKQSDNDGIAGGKTSNEKAGINRAAKRDVLA